MVKCTADDCKMFFDLFVEKFIIHYAVSFLFTFTSLLVTLQPVTAVTITRETSVVVKANLRASIGVFLTFVDILKTFSTYEVVLRYFWPTLSFFTYLLKGKKQDKQTVEKYNEEERKKRLNGTLHKFLPRNSFHVTSCGRITKILWICDPYFQIDMLYYFLHSCYLKPSTTI